MSSIIDVTGKPFEMKAISPNFKVTKQYLESDIAITRLLTVIGGAPDPDEMLRKAGIQRYQLKQLELDDEVAQCIDTRTEAVIATPWHLEPQGTRVTKAVHEILEPVIDDFRRGVMDSTYYGYSVHEIIFVDTKKYIGIDRVILKPMEWFTPQQDGTLRYFPDDFSGGLEGIPCNPLKFILARSMATYSNPYGKALLSPLYFPVTWRREGWGLWLAFLETFGAPIVLGQVSQYDDFVSAMAKQGVRSTVAWESTNDTDNISTINASTAGEFERLEKAIIRRVQKLILGQTLTSDVGTSGSYAVAAIHNEVRNDKRRADIRLQTRVCQQLVNSICAVNKWQAPKFLMMDDSGLEISRAQRDNILVNVLGSSDIRLNKSYFLNRYDLRPEDIEDIKNSNPTTQSTNDANQTDFTGADQSVSGRSVVTNSNDNTNQSNGSPP